MNELFRFYCNGRELTFELVYSGIYFGQLSKINKYNNPIETNINYFPYNKKYYYTFRTV